ncbi:inactive dipeptidyl peptidase 10-like [Daphnia carinata]|uniref:inactive dipeptidyl peptidase 10-like n=1 Tax=Daphnia carinata TaxID=120202 RepID=UPI00257C156D|nr:inactive dipeptidyl peptidase 10-like [Daphnia carinata]XP_059350740.1 inactive dipeptidyl peptidase 10-like [Daphnia carinata]
MHGNVGMEKNQWKVAEDDTVIVDPSDKEQGDEPHNWKATGIAICAITIVLLAVSTAALFMRNPEDEGAYWQTVSYDLNSVLDTETSIFISNSMSKDQWKSTYWISDRQLVYWDASGGLNVYRVATNQSAVLVPAHVVTQWRADEYWPSYDGRYVLLRQHHTGDSQKEGELYYGCHQPQRYYAVYDTFENDLWKIRLTADDLQPTRLGYVAWSGRSNQLYAIYRNRIFWTSDATSRIGWQLRGADRTLPKEPEQDFFCSGLPDWTYSEGVTRWRNLMWPNLGGDWLIYATLNSSQCHHLDFIEYLADRSRASSIRHAVPGGQLPEIQLKLIHLESNIESELAISQLANQRQWLLVQVEWLDATGFVTAWMTRNQNETRVFYCQLAVAECSQIILEEAVPGRWLVPPLLYPSPSGNGFVAISQTGQAEDGQRLVYHRPPWHKFVSLDIRQIDVKRIVGWHEANNTTYVLGTPTNETQKRHLYRVTDATIECLTCHLSADNCNFVDAKFELATLDFYELQCLGPHIPSLHVVDSEDNEILTTLLEVDHHGGLRDLLEHLTPVVKYLTIPLENRGVGRVQLLLPGGWNDKIYHTLRYPLIIQTLDWDEGDALTDQWRKDWASYFTLTRQVIYARVSGRDRANQYGSLQTGVSDLLTIVKFLMAELNHVESNAVVLIGKGIGGYLATMMMALMANEEEPIFKCGIVISPTTDWLRYEASIAERYLGDAVDQQYYVLSKTDKHIQMIKNDTILLMDSFPYNPVQHFQSVKFNSQLTKAGIRFDYKTYPQAGIKKMIEYHSYLSLEHFITQCLQNGN